MLNMNFFLLIFIACLVLVYYGNSIAQELENGKIKVPERDCPITDKSSILASVKEYSSFLHKCMATFISPTFLLTVASCVLCAEDCEFFVQLFRDRVENLDSDMLEKPVPQAPVFSLPDYYDNPFNILSNIYSWRFTEDKRDFLLSTNCVVTMSNYQCSPWTTGYVPSTAPCVYGNELLNLGPFDLGSPVIGTLEIGDEKIMTEVILGIFNGPRMVRETHVMLYKSVFPLLPWIQSVLYEARDERVEMRMENFKE